jgi:hypothetical protein
MATDGDIIRMNFFAFHEESKGMYVITSANAYLREFSYPDGEKKEMTI